MRLVPALALLLALTACGGRTESASPPAPAPATTRPCHHGGPLTARQRHWERRAQADLAAMRSAQTHARASTLTDRFLLDLGRGDLPIFRGNRLIDHAVAAVTGICEDCFQALEAARPIARPSRCTGPS